MLPDRICLVARATVYIHIVGSRYICISIEECSHVQIYSNRASPLTYFLIFYEKSSSKRQAETLSHQPYADYGPEDGFELPA